MIIITLNNNRDGKQKIYIMSNIITSQRCLPLKEYGHKDTANYYLFSKHYTFTPEYRNNYLHKDGKLLLIFHTLYIYSGLPK